MESPYRWVIVAAGGLLGCVAIGSMFSLPIFLQRISGDVFVDAGNANFGRFDPSAVLVGAGAELLVDIVAGYIIPFSARIGYARGFMAEGDDQVYGLFSSPF